MGTIEIISKSEWIKFNAPLEELNARLANESYFIERLVDSEGTTTWFGLATNWVKKRGGEWTKLTTNEDANPLEKCLPEIVYGEDGNYFAPCEIPIYEKLYMEYKKQAQS